MLISADRHGPYIPGNDQAWYTLMGIAPPQNDMETTMAADTASSGDGRAGEIASDQPEADQPGAGQPEADQSEAGRSGAGGKRSGSPLATRLLIAGLFAGGFLGASVLGLFDYLSVSALRAHRAWLTDQVADWGLVAGLVYMAIYALVVAFSLPGGAAMTIAGGFLFGQWLGTGYTVIGATVGAICLFLAARHVVGDSLGARLDPAVQRMEAGFRENELSYMFVLRLVPLFPFMVVNLAPALFGVRLSTFAISTFFGIIPGSFVYAGIGNGVDALFDAGDEPDLSGLFLQPDILTPIIGLVVLACIPIVYKHLKRRTAAGAAAGHDSGVAAPGDRRSRRPDGR